MIKLLAIFAVLAALTGAALGAEPLFENSVVSNDLEFIRSDDPSVAFEVIDAGRARKEMPDKRSDTLFANGAYVSQIKFADKVMVEVWSSPDFADRNSSNRYTALLAEALGKIPAAIRRKLSHVVIHAGDETAFAEEAGRFFVIYSENMDQRISTHDLEETVFHETVHATLEKEHAAAPQWIEAQTSDPGFITDYAAKHPQKEDLPESALFAYTLTKFPGRLPDEVAQAVRDIMPHRLKYLRQLFATLDPKPDAISFLGKTLPGHLFTSDAHSIRDLFVEDVPGSKSYWLGPWVKTVDVDGIARFYLIDGYDRFYVNAAFPDDSAEQFDQRSTGTYQFYGPFQGQPGDLFELSTESNKSADTK